MQEINIMDIFKYIKSKLIIIIIMVVIAVSIGISYKTFIEKPKYQSTTSLILAGFNTNAIENTIDNNELTINQKLVTTYQQITKSREVLTKVITELNLKYEVEELASHISVTNVTDTEIIQITVTDTNAKRAYKIVKKLAEVFTEKVKDIYNVSNVSILDKPLVAKNSSNMGLIKSSVLFVLAGIFIGLVVIIIMYYFDTSIKSAEQIESKFEIPVLGSIPNYDSKKKKKRGSK